MQEVTTLFEEDFSELRGVIAGDYSPAGEYHVLPTLSELGRWRETVIHHSYRHSSRGNWQVVAEADGEHVLEQTSIPKVGQPILAAGEPFWRDVTVETSLCPLSHKGWRAVIFRYRHSRRFYAVTFESGKVKVIRRDNEEDTVLGETNCKLDLERYTKLQVICQGDKIKVSIEGQEHLSCQDNSAGKFLEGCIALAANHVTRFSSLRVTAPADSTKAIKQEKEAIKALQARHPRPWLWKKIMTPEWGSDRNLRVGDINGDGQAEIVLARRSDRLGGDNYSSICGLAAYSLAGERLWTIGEPGVNAYHTTNDLCFQLHDIDGDGKAELFFCRDFEFCVADGETGEIMARTVLPEAPDQDASALYRLLGDSIYFCDLLGSGYPDTIILKDRYKNAWAYDKDLNLLWFFSGNTGHYPFALDVDNDGKDELALGHHLLDHDGTPIWSVNYIDHADNVALAGLHDEAGELVTRFVIAGSDAGFIILDQNGKECLRYPIGHAQSMCIANILPEREGLEIAVNTFWGPCGITAVFDEVGRLLHEFEPMPYASLLQPVNWVPFSGDTVPADLILLSTHPRQGGLIDGRGRRAVIFPDDGHPTLCSDARDLDGDGIDEVLTWDYDEIWIYKADVSGRSPGNYPRRNPWYNDSNYRAQLSIPVNRT